MKGCALRLGCGVLGVGVGVGVGVCGAVQATNPQADTDSGVRWCGTASMATPASAAAAISAVNPEYG